MQQLARWQYQIVAAGLGRGHITERQFPTGERSNFKAAVHTAGIANDRDVILDYRVHLQHAHPVAWHAVECCAFEGLIGRRQYQERTAVRPAPRQAMDAERGGEKGRCSQMPHLLQFQNDTREFTR